MLLPAQQNVEAANRLKAVLHDQAAVKAEDNANHSPLNMAAYYGSLTAVRMLIEAGADVNHADKSGHRPLHHVAHWQYKTDDELEQQRAFDIVNAL
eukprot:6712511-Pyramimonas_sp.AAC.2